VTLRTIAGGAELRVVADASALATTAAETIVAAAERAVAERGAFHLCSTGGSTPAAIYAALRSTAFASRMPWRQTTIWLGDDRFVPRSDPHSNLAAIDAVLLAPHADGSAAPMSTAQVEAWSTETPNADDAARAYAARATAALSINESGVPIFDLVLIGIGGDGHCLSVFPGSPLTAPDAPIAAGVAAPTHIEPHLPRLSFSLRILAAARAVLPLAAGAAKGEVLARIIDGSEPIATLPAKAALLPTATWLLDEAAASKLTGR
jgi:6-phosphogluconolactonase